MTTAILTVEHVTKRYGSGTTEVTAVRDVSLAVAPGEVVLIMGPSGSGKTTLLLMLGALLKPSEGMIALNNLILSALPEKELPDIRLHQLGFVFQDFNLLSALTVLENVAIVAELAGIGRLAARNKALTLLGELGLGERVRFLPEKLSGGEKQRVAIARALVNDPALILADEPTANLDSKIGREIMRLLQRITREQGRSVVIVSHDQRIKEIADRILWLEDGRFKALLEMATDPVCGMAVERDKAITAEWDGQTFYFCARGCRDEFVGTNQKRVSSAVVGQVAALPILDVSRDHLANGVRLVPHQVEVEKAFHCRTSFVCAPTLHLRSSVYEPLYTRSSAFTSLGLPATPPPSW